VSRDSFVFYRSFYEATRDLPRDVQGEVYTAVMEYGLYGITTENLKPVARCIFTLIKPQIDANNAKRNNGLKGGRPLKNKTEQKPDNNQNETKQEPNVNVNDLKEKTLKSKKEKKDFDLSFIESDNFRELFSEWLDYRKTLKKEYKSQKQVEIAFGNLLKKGNSDFETCKTVVYESIGNGYQGLFELKKTNYGKRQEQAQPKRTYPVLKAPTECD